MIMPKCQSIGRCYWFAGKDYLTDTLIVLGIHGSAYRLPALSTRLTLMIDHLNAKYSKIRLRKLNSPHA